MCIRKILKTNMRVSIVILVFLVLAVAACSHAVRPLQGGDGELAINLDIEDCPCRLHPVASNRNIRSLYPKYSNIPRSECIVIAGKVRDTVLGDFPSNFEREVGPIAQLRAPSSPISGVIEYDRGEEECVISLKSKNWSLLQSTDYLIRRYDDKTKIMVSKCGRLNLSNRALRQRRITCRAGDSVELLLPLPS